MSSHALVYSPDELAAALPPLIEAPVSVETPPFANSPSITMLTADELGLAQHSKLRRAIEHPTGRDRSANGIAVASMMLDAEFSDDQVAGVLLNPANSVSAHYLSQRDPERDARRAIDWVRAARSRKAQMVESKQVVPQLAAPKPATLLPFEWAGETKPVLEDLWLIHNWLPKSGIAMVYGHPGSGKSFLMLDMASHIARSAAWGGRTVEGGLVIYLAAEGQRGFRNRLFAMQQSGEIAPDAPFAFIPMPIDLHAIEGDIDSLIHTIEHVVKAAGVPLALLVIDTLSKTVGAGKENTDDMVAYINNCQRIASMFDCLTAVVHHRPKDSASVDIRGHSSLRGNIDAAILVERGKATSLKQKDGEDNVTIRFKLKPVVIGEDRHGNAVTTCLTEITDRADLSATNSHEFDERKGQLRGHNLRALQAVEEVIEAFGEEPPTNIPPDTIDRSRTAMAALAGQVEDRLVREFLALVEGDEDKKASSARRTAHRCLSNLKKQGILGTCGNWVWVN